MHRFFKNENTMKISKLFLVDLEGSERISKMRINGEPLEEQKLINKSLIALSIIVQNLSSQSKNYYAPYRDTKLTRIISDLFGGNAYTSLILTCSKNEFSTVETRNTLLFGERAKKIKNKPVINVVKENSLIKSISIGNKYSNLKNVNDNNLNEKIIKNEKEIKYLKIQIEELKNNLLEKDNQIINLKDVISKLETQKKNLIAELNILRNIKNQNDDNNKIKTMQNTIEELHDILNDKENELMQTLQENNNLKKNFENLSNNFDNEINEKNILIEQLSNDRDAHQKTCEELTNCLNEATLQIQNKEEMISELKNEINKIDNEKKNLNENIENNFNENLRNEKMNFLNKENEYTNKINDLISEIDKLKRELNLKNLSINDNGNQLQQYKNDIETLNEIINNKNKNNNNLFEENNSLKNQIQLIEKNYNNLIEKNNELLNQINSIHDDNSLQISEIHKNNNMKITEMQSEISALKINQDKNISEIQNLKQINQSNEDKCENLIRENNEYKKTINNLNNEINIKNKKIEEYLNKINSETSRNQNLNNLVNEINSKNILIEENRKIITELKTEIKTYKEVVIKNKTDESNLVNSLRKEVSVYKQKYEEIILENNNNIKIISDLRKQNLQKVENGSKKIIDDLKFENQQLKIIAQEYETLKAELDCLRKRGGNYSFKESNRTKLKLAYDALLEENRILKSNIARMQNNPFQ